MTSAVCPHCAATNDRPAEFCSACGLALPSALPTGPRILTAKGTAQTAAGQKLQSSELLNTARQAARSLLSIGVINLAFAAINIFIVYNAAGGRLPRLSPYFMAIIASMFIAGSLYIAMYFWARFSPLAATIVGLIVYLAKWAVDLTIQFKLLPPGQSANTNYSFFRLLMVFYLVRGIAAGWRHRKLEQEQREPQSPLRALPID
jgi:hypothetical protein